MVVGRYFVSTGFQRAANGHHWHLLIAVRRNWRFAFIHPASKPNYRRLYVGPLEVEWSRP